ncbi:hypothetical protein [Pandoraea communis]|uniref:hypothetical protein n=1 Tax=Pandoraea communis TaxID=2508297 RepID=UPI0025A594F0|nr:hypothetical protein [Pandoraea communis]MDM8358628.1 hypothetical protein [Pandoraea communis]
MYLSTVWGNNVPLAMVALSVGTAGMHRHDAGVLDLPERAPCRYPVGRRAAWPAFAPPV